MSLTRDFKKAVFARVECDPAFPRRSWMRRQSFGVIRKHLKVGIKAHTVDLHKVA